jgi:hypothetical protein
MPMLHINAIVNFESCVNFIGFVYIIFICCCHMLYIFKYDLVHISYSYKYKPDKFCRYDVLHKCTFKVLYFYVLE